ncbi:Uncharacterised protein [Enterobacter hormaechei]|nr:Uncharacterised protein [Enterobacter hormaechei]
MKQTLSLRSRSFLNYQSLHSPPEQHQPGKNRSRRKLPMWIQTRQSPPRAGRKRQRVRCMKRMGLSTDREGRNRFSEKISMKSLKPCQRKNSVTIRCFTVSTGKMRFTISATVSKCVTVRVRTSARCSPRWPWHHAITAVWWSSPAVRSLKSRPCGSLLNMTSISE